MQIEEQVTIAGSREAAWAVLTDIDRAAERISGIVRVEVLERPAAGLVGLRWRETRMMRGDEATVEIAIVAAEPGHSYHTRAEAQGFAFLTTMTLSGPDGNVLLTSRHASVPLTFLARLMQLPMALFAGTWRALLRQDLADIKAAVERGG